MIPASKIKNLAKKWNEELYAYLQSEREMLPDIHQRFENDRKQNEIETLQQRRRVAITKDGAIRQVYEHVVDKYIAEGWTELLVARNGKRPKKYYVNNGKFAFRVDEDEIQKFLDIGFVKGNGKGVVPPNPSEKKIRVNNGHKTISIYENCLEYWKAVGYQVGSKKVERRKKATAGYVWLWKGTKIISVPQKDVEKYLASGWKKGNPKVKVCNLDGEIKTICKDELEKYLSDNWVLFGISKLAREQKKKDRQDTNKILVHNGMTETYIDKDKLELFQQHGWQIGKMG